jgi:hypothetical protein
LGAQNIRSDHVTRRRRGTSAHIAAIALLLMVTMSSRKKIIVETGGPLVNWLSSAALRVRGQRVASPRRSLGAEVLRGIWARATATCGQLPLAHTTSRQSSIKGWRTVLTRPRCLSSSGPLLPRWLPIGEMAPPAHTRSHEIAPLPEGDIADFWLRYLRRAGFLPCTAPHSRQQHGAPSTLIIMEMITQAHTGPRHRPGDAGFLLRCRGGVMVVNIATPAVRITRLDGRPAFRPRGFSRLINKTSLRSSPFVRNRGELPGRTKV